MSTLASDTFSGTLANWIQNTGDFAIVSGQARATIDDSLMCYDGGVTWPNDQWSQITINTSVGSALNNGGGATVRCSASAGTDSGYEVYCSTVGTRHYKAVAGVFTALSTDGATTWAAGDTCYLEMQGNALISRKGGSGGTLGNSTSGDTTFTSGKPGITFGHGGATIDYDNWTGGDFSSATVAWNKLSTLLPGRKPGKQPPPNRFVQGFTAGGIPVTVALTGTALTISQGTLIPSLAVPLTGTGLTITEGTLTPNLQVALLGSGMVITEGTLVPVITISLTGTGLTITEGTMVPANLVSLTGQQITINLGTITTTGGTPVGGGPSVTSVVGFICNVGTLMGRA